MSVRLRWMSLLWLGLLLLTVPVNAQDQDSASLLTLQLDAFPHVEAYLDVHDASGTFIHGLQASDLRILENEQQVPVEELQELRPGVQVVFTLNPGPSFGIRNSLGISRYDFLVESLSNWAGSRQGSSVDDLSLLFSNGVERSHYSNPSTLLATLASYELDDTLVPGLDVLLRAIDIAADAPPRAGMERAVFFITSPIEGDVSFGLQSLISRANQAGVKIFIWLVASAEVLQGQTAAQLAQAAEQTDGQFFGFSGDEPLPNPERYLRSMRDIYRLTYQSQISGGDTQRLVVEISHDGQIIRSPELVFDFDLRPPNPAFISPELQITRALPEEVGFNSQESIDPAQLSPRQVELQVLVEYPDGRFRPIERTALYVDGSLVDENTEPPFDRFIWDISSYQEGGQHILQVEARDHLGLVGKSVEMPVEVAIDIPQPNSLGMLLSYWPVLVGLVVVLGGAALLLVLIMRGRIRPRVLVLAQRFKSGRRWLTGIASVSASAIRSQTGRDRDNQRSSSWVNRLHWPQRRLASKLYAVLNPVDSPEDATQQQPITVTTEELTFGRDAERAIISIDDPSLDPLHARLTRSQEGVFRVTDEGSVAGTWVNFIPVSDDGVLLEHGDLIYFGRVGFRFTQRDPAYTPKRMVVEELSR